MHVYVLGNVSFGGCTHSEFLYGGASYMYALYEVP